ncbi:hypothetical protein SAMN05216456_1983 [Devosia crocina]|uniref:DUF2188 domain-containing protein n=1 Tax=Devosia crocina TaxID=429728 RepID=A0A1I7NJD7_9HYPH|nr:hypothetical protein SAMN05216456_1983 [Devosia crocina]
MTEVNYEIVEHNGGFAYRVGDVFSETFATHQDARDAAQKAAQRQQLSGEDEMIQYQDSEGNWHEEIASGEERPEAEVTDELPETLEARDKNGEIIDERSVPDLDRAPIHLSTKS